jgi:hypothetical protein
LLLAAVVASSTIWMAAPAQAVVCHDDGTGERCDCAETINRVSRKLTGSDLVYCIQ